MPDEPTITLREYTTQLLSALRDLIGQWQEAHNRQHGVEKDNVASALASLNERLKSVNEFRESLNDFVKTLATRTETNLQISALKAALEKDIADLRQLNSSLKDLIAHLATRTELGLQMTALEKRMDDLAAEQQRSREEVSNYKGRLAIISAIVGIAISLGIGVALRLLFQ